MAVVGAGRVGTALGRLLADRGVPVTAVWSRDETRALAAAAFISPSTRVAALEELPRHAALVLVAVPDDAIESVARRLAKGGEGLEIALHTSGALDWRALGALAEIGVACGSIHPLQTVPSPDRGMELLPGSLFAVEGANAAVGWAERLVKLLNGKIIHLGPQAKPLYHAAATLVGNGVIALVWAAERILAECGLPEAEARALLQPLMESSLCNAVSLGPSVALTGPVARGDRRTVAQHWEAVAGCESSIGQSHRPYSPSQKTDTAIAGWGIGLASLLKDSERLP